MLVQLAAYLALSAATPLLHRALGGRVFLLLAMLPAATLAWAAVHAPGILEGGAVEERLAWAPGMGFDLALRVDAFALLMIGLVSGIGVLVFVYSRWYFGEKPGIGHLAALLLGFAGAMLGLVASDNLLALYLFWELTSVTSYLLIGFDNRSASARAAALRALLVTTAGSLALLAGLVLLGQLSGTLLLSELVSRPPQGPLAEVALALVLFGALTKSAQVPFHFWLPGAMAAPTPISAYLHSATMVKAGVYLVARLAPAFADVGFWRPVVLGLGVATLLLAGWRALAQQDTKLLLAYGTTSQLGFLMVLLGAGTEAATVAGVTLLLAHAGFKAALFLVVGVVDKAAGTRDLSRLSGMYRALPIAFATAAAAAASMAGLPPMLGFVAKETAFGALLESGAWWGPVVAVTVVAGSALTFAYSIRLVWGLFASKTPEELAPGIVAVDVRRPPWPLLAPATLLAALGVGAGVWVAGLSGLVSAAARALLPVAPPHELALWHGFNVALSLSVAAVAGGVVLWWARARVEQVRGRLPWRWEATAVYDRGLAALLEGAAWFTGRVQTGSLPMYLVVILATAVGLPGAFLLFQTSLPEAVELADRPMDVPIALLMAAAAIAAVRLRRRMAAVVTVSFVGYGVAFLFVIQGAPDLALTQLLVETLLLVLFVLVLRRLPPDFPDRRSGLWEAPRIALSAAVGLAIAAAVLVAGAARVAPSVSREHLSRAVPEGGGHNVVNVILVDFRAFDTYGEILVLTVAALGFMGLIRAWRRDPRTRRRASGHRAAPLAGSPILNGAIRALFHTILLFSLVLLIVGHDRPGGGFIGGLVAGAAFILVYLGGGERRVRIAEPLRPEVLLGGGTFVATSSGVLSWLAGGAFLESAGWSLELGALGKLALSTVLLFDAGVYLVVLGLVIALLRSAARDWMEGSA